MWVAVPGGVLAFTTEPFAPAGFLATHPGHPAPPAALEFSGDGRLLFVAHRDAPRLAAVDTAQRRLRPALELPGRPESMAFSALARRLYLTVRSEPADTEGRILVVDERPGLAATLTAPPSPGEIRFAGGGRHGIVLHPQSGRISILDTARGRVIQTASLDGIPDQLAFSNELAYLRLRDRTELLMLPLAALGHEGEKIPTFDTVGGDHGFLDGFTAIAAAGIAQPPGVDGVLIANPGDHAVYFYKEGLAAPMGQLLLPKIAPRAVLALDRSLRETGEPGSTKPPCRCPRPATTTWSFSSAHRGSSTASRCGSKIPGQPLRSHHAFHQARAEPAPPLRAPPAAAEPAASHSIPDALLLDQEGRQVHFYSDMVEGRVVAIQFIFTSCRLSCPLLGVQFGKLQKMLGDRLDHGVRLVSLSVDPLVDRPEKPGRLGETFSRPGPAGAS